MHYFNHYNLLFLITVNITNNKNTGFGLVFNYLKIIRMIKNAGNFCIHDRSKW